MCLLRASSSWEVPCFFQATSSKQGGEPYFIIAAQRQLMPGVAFAGCPVTAPSHREDEDSRPPLGPSSLPVGYGHSPCKQAAPWRRFITNRTGPPFVCGSWEQQRRGSLVAATLMLSRGICAVVFRSFHYVHWSQHNVVAGLTSLGFQWGP